MRKILSFVHRSLKKEGMESGVRQLFSFEDSISCLTFTFMFSFAYERRFVLIAGV